MSDYNLLSRVSSSSGCDSGDPEMQQEAGGESEKQQLSANFYYKYEELHSKPSITPESEIPEHLLHLSHSFGYDSSRRSNLKLLDDRTLMFVAGNLLVLLDVFTEEQKYLRSCSGGGIGCIAVQPSRKYFVVAEKGSQPNIIVYEYPSLRPYRILRGGTELEYSFVDFNHDGSLLASVGGSPDYMLTLWEWQQEEVMLSCKAVSQDVYRVGFSSYNPGLLTSSGSAHIKFWKITTTFTGLKLQGVMGHFGKTVATDIEGFMELPDGKVVSGTDWGNLLLWDGNTIKVEICCKDGRSCHTGTVQPFALEDGQLMTFGSDGVIRGWDFEQINSADSNSVSSRMEVEPTNEMVVGHNVCLSSMIRSSTTDSFVWFAQDSSGAIWKLDLSFTNTSPDPECLFSFHSGSIQGLDVSKKSHLMATTTLDRSVRVFDFVSKREVTSSRFNQGGTAVRWAPPLTGGLLAAGFEDGVVRLLELCAAQRLHISDRNPEGDSKLRLKQAFKPHNAPVTAIAYEQNGEILATGSSDSTVFFFTVGITYNPIGFIHVPGPVQAMEWSPHSHSENRLLVLCQNGHVVEVHSPDPDAQKPTKTFQLVDLPRRSFRFKSIKSRIKRLQLDLTGNKKQREERLEESKQQEAEQEEEEEEEEEELPPIYIPDPPSPLYCGFYSQPGQFWLSMGGYDSGYLYHCKFSENQDEDPNQQQDEPFDFLSVHNADDDPIHCVTFSSNRQLLLCGMHSGSIRVYPLQLGDLSLSSMDACWALNIHDNHYGHLRHLRCSHDDLFVLTAGDDGNIFSFSLLPPEELQRNLQRKTAKVPSPRTQQDHEKKQRKFAELQKKFVQVVEDNQNLPEHVRLKPEVRLFQLVFVCRFRESLQVTVVAIQSDHRISTYRLPTFTKPLSHQSSSHRPHGDRDAAPQRRKSRAQSAKDGSRIEGEEASECLMKLGHRQEERLRKAAEKAELARARIEKKKQEWDQIYAEKPDDDYEDPHDVQAIREAQENIGDVMVVKQPRINAMKKKEELVALDENVQTHANMQTHLKSSMNRRIVALRDSKVLLVSRLEVQMQQLQKVQQHLKVHLHRPPPILPTLSPEETPEEKLQCSRAMLEKYRMLKEQRYRGFRPKYTIIAVVFWMFHSVCEFDSDLLLLRRQKQRLDCRLKLADLRLLTLFQEMMLLKQFDKRDGSLQEKLNGYVKEENSVMQCNKQLEEKKRDILKLQEREKSLTAAFQASLGENNKFEEFLTKVFKKKVKRVKKNEQTGSEEVEDSDEDSDEDDDWDDDYDSDTEEAALDDRVCPAGRCSGLFENTLQLRERRLDMEELLVEEKKMAEALKREHDTLVKKEKSVKSSRMAVEDDLELINREKLQKMNELDVVVPLRLHQIEFVTKAWIPSDLSEALVLDKAELNRLQERIQELQADKIHQKDLYRQACQQQAKLIHDHKDMAAKIQGKTMLEKQCNELMMTKFGKLVDLEALQMLSGNRRLEELKHEKLLKEAEYAKEIQQWDVEEARQNLMEVTRCNTEQLQRVTSLFEQKKELELKLNARQKKMQQFQNHKRHGDQEDIRRLQELVKTQSQQAQALRREISLLSCKGGHVLPPDQTRLPPLAPLPTPMSSIHPGKQGPHRRLKAQHSASRQGAN
uniref:Cilia- and flagella-associated protein 44 n=1 Tax=Amphiprion percula TaxID=161767 RepID=A0A3P8TUV7_AMPPE